MAALLDMIGREEDSKHDEIDVRSADEVDVGNPMSAAHPRGMPAPRMLIAGGATAAAPENGCRPSQDVFATNSTAGGRPPESRGTGAEGGVGNSGGSGSTGSHGSPSDGGTPTQGWEYNPEVLEAALRNVPTEGKTIESLEEAVKEICAEHGVRLSRGASQKVPTKVGTLVMVALKCKNGIPNRQAEFKARTSGQTTVPRRSTSERVGCKFQVTVRWPPNSREHGHPRLSAMKLTHSGHVPNKAAVEAQLRMKAPLDSPMKDQVAKLTDKGIEPAMQAAVMSALHPEKRVNVRHVQNAAAGWERPLDARDRQRLYVDMLKETSAVVSDGVETVHPDTVRAIVAQFKESMNRAAMIQSGAGIAVGSSPNVVRLPSSASNKRHRSGLEKRVSSQGSMTSSQTYL